MAKMATLENNEVVRAFIAELLAEPTVAVSKYLDEEASWWVAGSLPVSCNHTKAELVEACNLSLYQFDGELESLLEEMTAEDDRVAPEISAKATVASARACRNQVHSLFTPQGGLITSVGKYTDTQEAKDVFFDTRSPNMSDVVNLEDFTALGPSFRIIEKGLEGIADGEHFFDLLAKDVVFDYIITIPGYPRHVEGRDAVVELYRTYGALLVLDSCSDLVVHHDTKNGVVVLEYASAGRAVADGTPYRNRYISVLTIRDGKISYWRDYLDPLAVFDAIGWPTNP
jgi:uncharacterized protein